MKISDAMILVHYKAVCVCMCVRGESKSMCMHVYFYLGILTAYLGSEADFVFVFPFIDSQVFFPLLNKTNSDTN